MDRMTISTHRLVYLRGPNASTFSFFLLLFFLSFYLPIRDSFPFFSFPFSPFTSSLLSKLLAVLSHLIYPPLSLLRCSFNTCPPTCVPISSPALSISERDTHSIRFHLLTYSQTQTHPFHKRSTLLNFGLVVIIPIPRHSTGIQLACPLYPSFFCLFWLTKPARPLSPQLQILNAYCLSCTFLLRSISRSCFLLTSCTLLSFLFSLSFLTP